MHVHGGMDYLLPPAFLLQFLQSSPLSKLLTEEAMSFSCFNIVLQRLFAMRALVSQVRYKTEEKFLHYIAAADFLGKMLPFLS